MEDEIFLVGIPKSKIEEWKEYGLLELLIEKTKAEVVLEIPILPRSYGFVRDHSLWSPKKFIDLYGIDLWRNIDLDSKEWVTKRIDAYRAYIESTTKLKEYKDNFIVPEVWIIQSTPLNLLKPKHL